METGKESNTPSNIKLASGFMNQSFDSEVTVAYSLFIAVGPNFLSCLVVDDSNQEMASEVYTNVSFDSELALKKVFGQSEVLNHLFKQVQVISCLPTSVIMPLDWLETEENKTLLFQAVGDVTNYAIETCVHGNNKYIFGIPSLLHKLLKNNYQNVHWSPMETKNFSKNANKVFVITCGHQFVMVMHHNQAVQTHWAQFDNSKSILFALLSYTEIEQIETSEMEAVICSNNPTVKEELLPYIKAIKTWQEELDATEQPSIFHKLINQLACE